MRAASEHDRDLEAWVLAAVAELDRRARELDVAGRTFRLATIAGQAAIDERVVAVVAERLAAARRLHAERVQVAGDREPRFGLPAGSTHVPATAGRRPKVDPSRFTFLRPQARLEPPSGRTRRCPYDPEARPDARALRARPDGAPEEHCDGSGWLVDEGSRTARPCACRELARARRTQRETGGTPNLEMLMTGRVRSLERELVPSVAMAVSRWVDAPEPLLEAGSGLWLVMPTAGTRRPPERDVDRNAPLAPTTIEEFEAATERAGQTLDAPVAPMSTPVPPEADGGLDDFEMGRVIASAAGYAVASIVSAVHYRPGRTVAFFSLVSLRRSLGWLARHGGLRARIDALAACDLVVLAGLDHRHLRYLTDEGRAWTGEQLETIARRRYENAKSTILLSTGWPPDELAAALGDHVFDRLWRAAGAPLLSVRPPQPRPSFAEA